MPFANQIIQLHQLLMFIEVLINTKTIGHIKFSCLKSVDFQFIKAGVNKIRDFFKVKLYTIRYETLKEREREKKHM